MDSVFIFLRLVKFGSFSHLPRQKTEPTTKHSVDKASQLQQYKYMDINLSVRNQRSFPYPASHPASNRKSSLKHTNYQFSRVHPTTYPRNQTGPLLKELNDPTLELTSKTYYDGHSMLSTDSSTSSHYTYRPSLSSSTQPSIVSPQQIDVPHAQAGPSRINQPSSLSLKIQSISTPQQSSMLHRRSEPSSSEQSETLNTKAVRQVNNYELTMPSNQSGLSHSHQLPVSTTLNSTQSSNPPLLNFPKSYIPQVLQTNPIMFTNLPQHIRTLSCLIREYQKGGYSVKTPEEKAFDLFLNEPISLHHLHYESFATVQSSEENNHDELVVFLFRNRNELVQTLNNARAYQRKPMNLVVVIIHSAVDSDIKNDIIRLCKSFFNDYLLQLSFKFIHPGLRYEFRPESANAQSLERDGYYKCLLIVLNMWTKNDLFDSIEGGVSYNIFHKNFWWRFKGIFKPLGFHLCDDHTTDNISDNFIKLLNIKKDEGYSILENAMQNTEVSTIKQFIKNNNKRLKKEVESLAKGTRPTKIKHKSIFALFKNLKAEGLTNHRIIKISKNFYNVYNEYYKKERSNWISKYYSSR